VLCTVTALGGLLVRPLLRIEDQKASVNGLEAAPAPAGTTD